jgi:arsenate reductase
MKKVFLLANCSTCQRIIAELDPESKGLELQEIKSTPITSDQLEELARLAGSYEALFSRRAMKYRALNLQDKNLTEEDYKGLILSEYTFLKRPVIVEGENIFIGSSKKTVAAALEHLT